MKTVSVAEVETRLRAYIHASTTEPVVLTQDGKPVAILLAVTDPEEVERLLLAVSPKLHTVLEAAEQRIQATGGLQHEAFWEAVAADEERQERI